MPAARGDEGALCIERATKGEDAARRVLYSLDYCTDSRGRLLYSNLPDFMCGNLPLELRGMMSINCIVYGDRA